MTDQLFLLVVTKPKILFLFFISLLSYPTVCIKPRRPLHLSIHSTDSPVLNHFEQLAYTLIFSSYIALRTTTPYSFLVASTQLPTTTQKPKQDSKMADHGQELIRAAATTPASMYNGSGTTIGGVPVTRGGDHWWSTAVAPQVPSCSTPEMHGVNAWSAESPRSNSLATASSITFQEPAGVGDPAIMSAGWNQPFL